MLNELAHREDSSRPTICAVNGDMKNSVNWISDVNSFNIYEGWYGGSLPGFANWADAVHKAYPDRRTGVSEWGAGANPTQHQDPPVQPKTDGPFHPEEYQNLLHETYWLAMKDRPFLWWKSLWNGFDFASDSRHEGGTPGMNDKGLTTYDRKLHKDAYYWYKANWSSSPVCYITSRRYRPRTVPATAVKVYSNCDTVELKVNGISLGTLTSPDRRFIWKDVTLSPCENKIEAVGKKGESAFPDSCVWFYENGSPCEEGSE
jgi:beta-galactosidase